MRHHRWMARVARLWSAAVAAGLLWSPMVAAGPDSESEILVSELVPRLLGEGLRKVRPPYSSDAAHARTVAPVLTRGAAVWIREERLRGLTAPAARLIVEDGRVFRHLDAVYRPLGATRLRIRPIDDRQEIPLVLRVVVTPEQVQLGPTTVRLIVPQLALFNARLEGVRGWVESTPIDVTVDSDSGQGILVAKLILRAEAVERAREAGGSVVIVLEGALVLGPYDVIPRGAFGGSEDRAPFGASESQFGLALAPDAENPADAIFLRTLATSIAGPGESGYDTVVAVNRWVSSNLQYRETTGRRTPREILFDGAGDCEDYTAVMVALLRAKGLPARRATGELYDLEAVVPHSWVEVALPLRRGGWTWLLCDPTLAHRAATDQAKSGFVQHKSRVHLYSVHPHVEISGFGGSWSSDILLNWRNPRHERLPSDVALNELVTTVILEVDAKLSRQAGQIAVAGLTLEREYATMPGSRYLVGSLGVPERESARLDLWLVDDEQLILELRATGEALHGDAVVAVVDRIAALYAQLNERFFAGRKAHLNFELLHDREPHTDRLRAVRLRIDPFVLENQGSTIVRRMARHDLITDRVAELLTALLEISDGRNLYVLQELARQQ